MAKYTIQVSAENVIEVDTGPGAPPLTGVHLAFDVSGGKLASTLEEFGGADCFDRGMGLEVYQRRLAFRRDGERAGEATLWVWEVAG